MLVVRGLCKSFPARGRHTADTAAVDHVDLEVSEGTFTSVLGPSGSGKTTLLRCIAGFEPPDAGTITLAGRTLDAPGAHVRSYERGVAVVPQEGALFPHLSAAQNIAFGLADRPRRQRRERVAYLLDLVGLRDLGHRRPHQLSGGQQQRIALARALAPEPRLILLDEPFSALDAQLRVDLREEVRTLLGALGATTILVTHDQAEALAMGDRLVVMREGRIVASGRPREVYESPADVPLGRFLGDAVVVPGRVTREESTVYADCALGKIEVGNWHGEEGTCDVLVRPEQLVISGAATDPVPGGVTGVVTTSSYFGHDTLVRIALDNCAQTVAVRVPGSDHHPAGEPVVLTVIRPVSTYAATAANA